MDWNDLNQHLSAQYRGVKLEPHWIGIELAFEAGDVRIKIERVTVFEEPWVLVITPICGEKHVDAMAALRYNALIAVASIVVENERCYLRAALPLEELSGLSLDRTIDFVARESIKLRRALVPSADVAKDLFRIFEE